WQHDRGLRWTPTQCREGAECGPPSSNGQLTPAVSTWPAWVLVPRAYSTYDVNTSRCGNEYETAPPTRQWLSRRKRSCSASTGDFGSPSSKISLSSAPTFPPWVRCQNSNPRAASFRVNRNATSPATLLRLFGMSRTCWTTA